ncbi:hypothetical protein L0156_26970 [bacterium]|nr:hypothetical protein [bacterium]
MRTLLVSFLLFSLFAQKDVVLIDSRDLLTIPKGVQGQFKIASVPPKVETILFAGLPPSKEALWSSWGDGCFASNGKYYTAIGDHGGYSGNSYIYEYDPATKTLKEIVDIAEAIKQKPGEYGHGKIHTSILEHKSALYFATYWGKQRQVQEAYNKGYKGSLLFRYDLRSRVLENLGAVAARKGLPASTLDPSRELLYFYAVENEKGDVVVYDLKKRQLKFQGGADFTADHRSFLRAKDGKMYFSDKNGKLSFYDPDKNTISPTGLVLPGPKNSLRASSPQTSGGIIFGMTRSGRLFAFDPFKQTIRDLGPNFLAGDYTAVIVLSPDEKYLYYAPGAHGSAAEVGTPVIQYRIQTGERKVIAFLRDSLMNKANYFITGNYNMRIDPKGATLYCTFNGSKNTSGKKQEEFGLPSLVVIHIPESERK